MLVRTATALLEGGNVDVQGAFMRLLSHRTEPFLRGIATRIERTQVSTCLCLRVPRRLRGVLRRPTTPPPPAQGITAMLPEADVKSSKQRKVQRLRRSDAQIKNAEAIFKLLQVRAWNGRLRSRGRLTDRTRDCV